MCLKRWIAWVHSLVWFGLLSCCITLRVANGEDRIVFGKSWYHADSAEWQWILEHEQAGFFRSGEVLATLPIRQKMVALYSHTSTSKSSVYLSVFEQGQEQRLWETTTFPGTDVRLWNPILLSGNLTAHSSPDLLLVYWPNKISTSEGKFQTQFSHLFLNWQKATDDPIPLSALDLSISEPNAASVLYYAYQKPGEPAGQRYSLVLLLPALQDVPFTMYVWSRIEQYKDPATTRAVFYQLTEYQATESQVVKIRDIAEQRYVQEISFPTADLLRSVIQTAREQGREPLLLDFDAPEQEDVLCNEEKWFGLMEEWGKRGLD